MKKRKQGVTGNEVKPRWELDYDLLENEGLFGEYLEMGRSHYGEKKHFDWLNFSNTPDWKFWLKVQENARG